MSQPKLFAVLEKLTISEWENLRKHLLMSSLHNSNLMQLFDLLCSEKGDLLQMNNTEVIRSRFFNNMNQKLFSNLCSRTFLQVEDWLATQQMKQDRYLSQLLLVKFYNRRGLFKLANQTSARLDKLIKETNEWDLENDKAKYELMHQQYYSDNPIKYKQGGLILEDLVKTFSSSVKCQSLMYLCELYNWGSIQSYDYDLIRSQLESAIEQLPEDDFSEALSKLKRLISDKEESDLYELSKFLYDGKIRIGSDLHMIFSLYLIQYALSLWQNGKDLDLNEISKLYNYGLTTGVLLVDGLIPLPRFHYICSVISATNSFDFTKEFINKWINKVHAKDNESIRLIALAQNCLYHDKEEEIMKLVRAVKFEHEEIKLRVGALKIISLYKTREQDLILLHNQIQNFKIILKRQRKNSNKKYKEGLINFVKIIQLLLKREYKTIEIDLSKYDNVLFRSWLQKQLKI